MTAKMKTYPSKINTHDLIVGFGKHKGERWTRIPQDYLRWLINEKSQYSEIAKAELERRGASLTGDIKIKLSGHAIDRASLRLRKTWHETALNKDEGLYSWLERIAIQALESCDKRTEKIKHNGIKFVFSYGDLYPTLKTVM